MMLENIAFNGFSVKSSSYKVNDIAERGTFNVMITEVNFQISDNDSSVSRQITLSFVVEMFGHAEGVNPDEVGVEPAFEATFAIDAFFRDFNSEPISQVFIETNMWFFTNFYEVITKITADNLFKNSELGEMPIPWSSKGNSVLE